MISKIMTDSKFNENSKKAKTTKITTIDFCTLPGRNVFTRSQRFNYGLKCFDRVETVDTR